MFGRIGHFVRSFNTLYFSYLVTAVGFVITAVFIWVLWDLYSIGGDIDAEEMAQTGQVGDFFGGVVGSIWALAGVFLYFSAIKMQKRSFPIKWQLKEKIGMQNVLDSWKILFLTCCLFNNL